MKFINVCFYWSETLHTTNMNIEKNSSFKCYRKSRWNAPLLRNSWVDCFYCTEIFFLQIIQKQMKCIYLRHIPKIYWYFSFPLIWMSLITTNSPSRRLLKFSICFWKIMHVNLTNSRVINLSLFYEFYSPNLLMHCVY